MYKRENPFPKWGACTCAGTFWFPLTRSLKAELSSSIALFTIIEATLTEKMTESEFPVQQAINAYNLRHYISFRKAADAFKIPFSTL